jgi:hypothetical protein
MTATRVVDDVISGEIRSTEQLGRVAPQVLDWLKENLPLAHQDKDLNHRIRLLLGAPRFVPNLSYFGLWADLIKDCKAKALELGWEMQQYYTDNDLGNVLGAAAPNIFGKIQGAEGSSSAGSDLLIVAPCKPEACVKRQDAALPFPFPQNPAFSQFWNEQCFIHCLRMIAMGIDLSYQDAVEEVCRSSKGHFKRTPIKGYPRMKNKCISKKDHYYEEYPRLEDRTATFRPTFLITFVCSRLLYSDLQA